MFAMTSRTTLWPNISCRGRDTKCFEGVGVCWLVGVKGSWKGTEDFADQCPKTLAGRCFGMVGGCVG